MTNPFRDQEKFMKACDQTTDTWNVEQFNLYVNLIEEEFNDDDAIEIEKQKQKGKK